LGNDYILSNDLRIWSYISQEPPAALGLYLAEIQAQREQRRRCDQLDVATGMERTVVR